jgi:tRNA(Ile)-lysidine synthase
MQENVTLVQLRMHDFIKKVKNFISVNKMIHPGEKIVVGVSGGPDSLSLLYTLFNLKDELNFTLHIAHLDHKFRGVESATDASFVEEHARKLGIAFTIEAIDVASIIRINKLSFEDGARRVRYEFYDRVATEVDADKVALGHNADDQAETMLMRLFRGAGSHGLSGIPKVRDGKYIRPLLSSSRREIEKFLSDLGLSPRQDSSNQKAIYLRNKIRLELLPLLEAEYNPKVKNVLCRTAEILQSESELLDKIAEENLSTDVITCHPSMLCEYSSLETKLPLCSSKHELAFCCDEANAQTIEININNFNKQHLAIQRRILRHCIANVADSACDVCFEHIESILNLTSNSKPNCILILPHNVEVIKSYDKLIIRKAKLEDDFVEFEYELNVPGITELPELNSIIVTKLNENCSNYEKKRFFAVAQNDKNQFSEVFDFEKINQPLQVRNRRRGDRFQPLGMRGEKKLKDFFIDAKVPKKLRDQIPILVSGDEILWVVGYRMSDRFKVTDSTRQKLAVSFFRKT